MAITGLLQGEHWSDFLKLMWPNVCWIWINVSGRKSNTQKQNGLECLCSECVPSNVKSHYRNIISCQCLSVLNMKRIHPELQMLVDMANCEIYLQFLLQSHGWMIKIQSHCMQHLLSCGGSLLYYIWQKFFQYCRCYRGTFWQALLQSWLNDLKDFGQGKKLL